MVLFPPSPGGGQEIGHGYKGKGILLHLLTDTAGNPIAITTTAANKDERQEVKRLLGQVKHLPKKNLQQGMMILEADKGYDCSWLRQALLAMNIFPLIPYRKILNREAPATKEICETFNLQRQRWKVERAFAWLKRKCRRLMLRWERKARIWSGIATLGLVYLWIKNLVG